MYPSRAHNGRLGRSVNLTVSAEGLGVERSLAKKNPAAREAEREAAQKGPSTAGALDTVSLLQLSSV